MPSLAELTERAKDCTACHLHQHANRTVFGEGPPDAKIVLVGEQPGDQEDLQGRPFVGPAGKILDRALVEGGVDRSKVYVTNAVKHFKFVQRGTRRLHQKPDSGEIEACKFWLLSEIETLEPGLVVALGATAAQALKGRTVTIGKERGRFAPFGPSRELYVTVHPSYLLRLPEPALQEREYARFVDDMRKIAAWAPQPGVAAEAQEVSEKAQQKGQLDLL